MTKSTDRHRRQRSNFTNLKGACIAAVTVYHLSVLIGCGSPNVTPPESTAQQTIKPVDSQGQADSVSAAPGHPIMVASTEETEPREEGGSNPRKDRPAFETLEIKAWEKSVAALNIYDQIVEVEKKLKELDPEFDGSIGYNEKDRVITEVWAVNAADISPLRVWPTLKRIQCVGEPERRSSLSDLSPLRGMALTSLCCAMTHVTDLSPLKGMQLKHLDANDMVTDLSVLKGMPLVSLSNIGPHIRDLSVLQGLPLEMLYLEGATGVSDLSPLRGMNLKQLFLNGTQVSDLSPLAGMPLEKLSITNTKVKDLSPLKGMPLEFFTFDKTLVTDISPLQGMEIGILAFTPENVTQGIEAIRQMQGLYNIGIDWYQNKQYRPEDFWKKYDAGEFNKSDTVPNNSQLQQ